MNMNYALYVVKNLGLFSLIGFSVYYLESIWPFLALLFIGDFQSNNNDKEE